MDENSKVERRGKRDSTSPLVVSVACAPLLVALCGLTFLLTRGGVLGWLSNLHVGWKLVYVCLVLASAFAILYYGVVRNALELSIRLATSAGTRQMDMREDEDEPSDRNEDEPDDGGEDDSSTPAEESIRMRDRELPKTPRLRIHRRV